jgi:adenosylcobinamide-GDP ribazoletransferase
MATMALGLPPVLAAGLALAAQIITTGALHEDGLADLADGFWGGRDPARRLEIMRDSRIGSYGTLALVVSVGLRWQALAVLAGQGAGLAAVAILAVAMTSRAVPAVLLAVLPPARSDGMGRLASGGAGPEVVAAVLLAGLPALALSGMLPAMALQAAFGFGVARLSLAKIGGQTGDVLGAAQQLAEIAALLVLAAI